MSADMERTVEAARGYMLSCRSMRITRMEFDGPDGETVVVERPADEAEKTAQP